MFDDEQQSAFEQAIQRIAEADRERLNRLRKEVAGLRALVRPIQPRSITAISLVAMDGGENRIPFDPFLIYPVRVVDSYGKPFFVDALAPHMNMAQLNDMQFERETPLGLLMKDLGAPNLWALSRFIPSPDTPFESLRLNWVRAYRDLVEWSVLYYYVTRTNFATDTLIVRDGFLRSLVFEGSWFAQMWERIRARVDEIYRRERRRLFIVGVAKRSKIIDRYHLAFVMEGVLVQQGACYLPVVPPMEEQVYRWTYYEQPTDAQLEMSVSPYKVGYLYLAKFGPQRYDPIYAVDIWRYHQELGQVDEVFSYLLADAQVGFPQPFYPLRFDFRQLHNHCKIALQRSARIIIKEYGESLLTVCVVIRNSLVNCIKRREKYTGDL